MPHFDVVIVGTGSGNSILDERFAGWDVALVERGRFGGTCLNVGCIPTKMFVYTADVAGTPAEAAKLGVDQTLDHVRWRDIRDRIFGRIDPIAESGREYRIGHDDNRNVTVYLGNAVFSGHKELTITPEDGGVPETITADQIVVAAGGRPVVPDIDGLAELPYHTSDTVMRLEKLPRRMTILGGGFVAAEFAHVFSSLGVEVTVVARSGSLLRAEDAGISARFTELARHRWDVRLHTKVVHAEQDGQVSRLQLEGPRGEEVLETDVLLVATGRRPNTDQLDVAATGLQTRDGGHLVVDEYQRTTVDGIWALGDISSPWTLKHVANHEQRVVQHNLLYPDELVASDHRFVPHAVFSSPQIAAVGLTEQAARERDLDYVVATQDYSDVAYGWAMENTTGFAKVLADPRSGTLLGAHILGPQAPTLIQPFIQAMSFGLDARTMARGQYWIHPALPELIENALLKLPLDASPAQ
ncbi:mycothione reductase [Actinobacteria bacterium YIM 96077]|uniref:Mycothione reductase n=1 Tax=Phytoactinopolyspora halophila TaxID=1981511 RepID=A0A329QAY4_9ACTN|nr:mycothione reductase [Phytoactinopolyspora halophila]AYY15543.1 mycothione reductase [Actinobacteria bacterium YIM 96077]RAW09484.1 mycothione reductase [Phytoactinopolyspora halophila]